MTKRILAFLIGLVIVITSCLFFVSAEDEIFAEFSIIVEVDGTSYALQAHEYASISFYFTDTNYHTVTLKSINYKEKVGSDYTTFNADIRFLYYGDGIQIYNSQSANVQNVNMDLTWYSVIPHSIVVGAANYFSCNVGATLNTRFSTSNANRAINSTVTVKRNASSQAGSFFYIYLSNVYTGFQNSFFVDFLEGWFTSINDNAYSAAVKLRDLCNEFFDLPKWDISINSYDDKGNFIQGETYGTSWTDAIYQTLQNIYQPFHNQAVQEQAAKDAGALDALDNAYEAAEDAGSFWDLIPFIGFAGFGDYDDDAASDLGSDSVVDWFSNTNLGWLDQVGNDRGLDDDFVDFYSQNIQDIEDMLGADTVRSIRGEP